MDVLAALAARKMTRAFTGVAPSRSTIESLVYAATRGPSAGNTSSVEVLVLEHDAVSAYWDITLPEARRAGFAWPGLLRAPVLLIPTVDPGDYLDRYAESDKVHSGLDESTDDWPVPYWWVDGGAAVENILLAATALGEGACFFGQFDNETAVSAHFGIPTSRRSLGTIAIGEPDGSAERPSRSSLRPARTVDERTHWGTW